MSNYHNVTIHHEPLIAAFRQEGVLEGSFKEVCEILDRHVRVVDDRAMIVERDGQPALNPADEWRPHDAQSFVRHLRQSRPHLFDRQAAPPAVAPAMPTKAPAADANLTELMARARAGDAGARAAIDSAMREKFGLDDPSAPNMTATMSAARRGDAEALTTLEKWKF